MDAPRADELKLATEIEDEADADMCGHQPQGSRAQHKRVWKFFCGMAALTLFTVVLSILSAVVLLGLPLQSRQRLVADLDKQVLPVVSSCFLRQTFGLAEVEVIRDVRYGGALNPFAGRYDELYLDFYGPGRLDARSVRPAVVLLHGGYFASGEKGGDSIPQLAMVLAQHGYVVASINYRKIPASQISMDLVTKYPHRATHVVSMVQEDARAAVRFMRKMAQDWRIDTRRIVVGGDSAGAIAALYYGYVKNATEGSSGNPGFSSNVSAVMAISGTLRGEAYCSFVDQNFRAHGCRISSPPAPDLVTEISAGDVPLLLWHGMQDHVIPVSDAVANLQRATAVGVMSLLLLIPDGGHVPMTQGLDPLGPYLRSWLTFLAGALKLSDEDCPRRNPPSQAFRFPVK